MKCPFERCPRCGGKWDRDVYKGTKAFYEGLNVCLADGCYMRYRDGKSGNDEALYIYNWLCWHLETHQCTVYILSSGKSFVMPWLPYNVSREEVNKYLILI